MKRLSKDIVGIINQRMSENERIRFNLFYLISGDENAFWATDDESYIMGQTNEHMAMWIWVKEHAGEDTLEEVRKVIEERLELNPDLEIVADEVSIRPILDRISVRKEVSCDRMVSMIAYRCDKVADAKDTGGHMILSNETHKEILQKFIAGMIGDIEGRPMQEEAKGFANAVTGSSDFYLWEDNGQVVSMAMIAHRTEGFARINTVYTDSLQRGNGYAGMLVSAVTQKILDEGRIPMLYAEQHNVYSNAVYRRIGYVSCGELIQVRFV